MVDNCSSCNAISLNSLFGGQQSIKYNNGDLIATLGPNVTERLILSDLRVPYKQIVKSRVLLKPGAQDYLLNYSGLGDNTTFLALYAKYDPQSRNEMNNYLEYYFYNDPYRTYFMSQILTLSGNSTHRIPQMYLSNNNLTYSVSVDIMAAIIDDETSYFYGVTGPALTNAIQFIGLGFSLANGFSIQTYTAGGKNPLNQWDSFAIYNSSNQITAFLEINTISTVQLSGTVIIIDDSSVGIIYMQFLTVYDADQAYSAINYAIENRSVAIPFTTTDDWDDTPPLIIFTQNIDLIGGTFGSGITYSSTYSNIFIGNTVSISTYGGTISKVQLASYSFTSITDNRDGIMPFTDSYITVLDSSMIIYDSITGSGTFSLLYMIKDLAGNPTQSSTNFTIILPVI